jgi:signal peptidase II
MGAALAAWCRAGATLGVTVGADQALKAIVVASVERGKADSVLPGIDLTYVRNEGVAFGAFDDGGTLIVLGTAVALALLVGYFALRAAKPWLWLPVGVLLGGAFGNLADRARDGAVIDYLDPVLWPAFNLADVGIVLGLLGLLYVIEGGPSRQ